MRFDGVDATGDVLASIRLRDGKHGVSTGLPHAEGGAAAAGGGGVRLLPVVVHGGGLGFFGDARERFFPGETEL